MCECCEKENVFKRKPIYETEITSVFIDVNYELGVFNDLDGGSDSAKINYCPMCGRKLVD